MARPARDKWAKYVQRWKESGLSAREFAAEMGLNAGTLSYWNWRLGKERKEAKRGSGRKGRRDRLARREPEASLSFVEVATPTPAGSERVEVVVGDHYRVRVPDGFDGETLRRVLDVVEKRS